MAPKDRRTYNTPGHAHEITFSTYRRQRLLAIPELAGAFVKAVLFRCEQHSYDLWAFVVMPEHVHLLVYPRKEAYNVQQFRSSLRVATGQSSINWLRKHRPEELARIRLPNGKSRLWQDGEGYDRNLFSSKAIWSSIDYIHTNPVRRGLCESPRDWRWSSVLAYEGGTVEGVTLCPVPRHPVDDKVFRAYY